MRTLSTLYCVIKCNCTCLEFIFISIMHVYTFHVHVHVCCIAYLLYIRLESEHVVTVLTEGFPLVVDGIREHPKGVDITELTATLGEDILRGKVVQRGIGVNMLTGVPLTKLK